MAFRDEAHALRSRIDTLQGELSRTQDEAEELRDDAERTAELEKELDAARKRLVKLESHQRAALLQAAPALVVVIVLMGMGAGMYFVLASRSPDPPTETHPPVMAPVPAPPARPLFAPIAFTATASEVVGEPPLGGGTTCEVLIAPTDSTPACRVTVTCGGELAFGGDDLGYLACALGPDGRPTTGADVTGLAEEGDAMLHMELPAGWIRVSNDRPQTWSFLLRVPEPI